MSLQHVSDDELALRLLKQLYKRMRRNQTPGAIRAIKAEEGRYSFGLRLKDRHADCHAAIYIKIDRPGRKRIVKPGEGKIIAPFGNNRNPQQA